MGKAPGNRLRWPLVPPTLSEIRKSAFLAHTKNVTDQPIESFHSIGGPPEETTAAEPAVDVVLTADEILEQMATVRRQIHERSDEVVTSTKELTDWRFYVRRHPWASVIAAAVIGYAIVPGKTKSGAEDFAGDTDDPSAASRAEELTSALLGAVTRAAVAHVSRTLGDVFSGFFTADDGA